MKRFLTVLSIFVLVFASCELVQEAGREVIAHSSTGNTGVPSAEANVPETGGATTSVVEEAVTGDTEIDTDMPDTPALALPLEIGPIQVYNETTRYNIPDMSGYEFFKIKNSIPGTDRNEKVRVDFPRTQRYPVYTYIVASGSAKVKPYPLGKVGAVSDGKLYMALPDISELVEKGFEEWDTHKILGGITERTPGMHVFAIHCPAIMVRHEGEDKFLEFHYATADGYVIKSGHLLSYKKGYNIHTYKRVPEPRSNTGTTIVPFNVSMEEFMNLEKGVLWNNAHVFGSITGTHNPPAAWVTIPQNGAQAPFSIINGLIAVDESYFEYEHTYTQESDPLFKWFFQ